MIPVMSLAYRFGRPLSFNRRTVIRAQFVRDSTTGVLFRCAVCQTSSRGVITAKAAARMFLGAGERLRLIGPTFCVR